ncbi:hypothetical protein GQ53DRAFT_750292 [Thozetella sp. PMI_491]|nr:hypothetical protein GQ53DRAFT_750292 [Thozetella sp. PMI_491]
MADDTREAQNSGASTAVSTTGSNVLSGTPAPLPKGMVLGKDGKPCRTCSSLAAFSSQTKTLKGATMAPTAAPRDCPADVETLGRGTWTLLHSIAATYPTQPTAGEQADLRGFFRLFSKLYPCWVCAEDFQQYMRKETIRTGSREEFGNWLCEAHNEVNKKLGKPTFDCSKWEERWRTGWRDGRCD